MHQMLPGISDDWFSGRLALRLTDDAKLVAEGEPLGAAHEPIAGLRVDEVLEGSVPFLCAIQTTEHMRCKFNIILVLERNET
jgi:hypothetical protein